MKKEVHTVCYDEDLQIEAYHFEDMQQPFPNHFHEYYVIGFVENGKRILSCRSKEYRIEKGNIILFHPGDNHACYQCGKDAFDYRGFHIARSVMQNLTEEITGEHKLPGFSQNVIFDEELADYLLTLHRMIMNGAAAFEKEEILLLAMSLMIRRYGQPFESCIPECREEIERICRFLKEHFTERITLEELCRYSGLSKSTLLRAFTKSKGITPYRYLETIRISEAKKLLEQGVAPVDAAMQTGFSDQSHFTNFFNMFIGLTPGIYREIFLKKEPEVQGGEKTHDK